MRDWTELAEALKQVRSGEADFLGYWAVEEAVIRPGLDRVAADITDGSWTPAELGDDFHGGDFAS